MNVRKYPSGSDRPHIFAANFLKELGLKVEVKWHYWDDLFPWGWQVKGYRRTNRKLFGRWELVWDIWPGEFNAMGWDFNDGAIRVVDSDYADKAVELASQIEARFGNKIAVTIPEREGIAWKRENG